MNTITICILGLIAGICLVSLVILWGLINISGQISREEERRELNMTLKELKDTYLPNRDLDDLRGVVREESE